MAKAGARLAWTLGRAIWLGAPQGFQNGSLAFVELEQRAEGPLDCYTDLKNPDFGRVAEATVLWGGRVARVEELEEAVLAWLATPGPALLDVVTDRFEFVMPCHVDPAQVFGTALNSAKAVLGGWGDVVRLVGQPCSLGPSWP